MAFNKSSGYWQGLMNMVSSQIPAFGNILVVLNASDTDEANYQHLQDVMTPDNDGFVRFYTSLSDALDAAESNNNDVILLDSNSTHTLTTGYALTKNRVHLMWMDGWDRLVQQGAKVQTTDAAAVAYVLKNTGTRNTFTNIKFIMNDTNAAALNVIQGAGEGNVWKNCSFVFGVNDNIDLTTASEYLAGNDSDTFIDCTFGSDTLLTTAARAVMTVDQVTASQEFKSNRFRGCTWMISSSSATATFIKLAAVTDILFTNLFEDCNFVASVDSAGWIALNEAVQTWTGTSKGTLLFARPSAFNVTNFAVATGGRNAAVQVVAAASVAAAIEWITPIA